MIFVDHNNNHNNNFFYKIKFRPAFRLQISDIRRIVISRLAVKYLTRCVPRYLVIILDFEDRIVLLAVFGYQIPILSIALHL